MKRKDNPEAYRAATKKYYKQNAEQINERVRQLRQAEPDRFREYDQKSWNTNREARLAQKKEHWKKEGRKKRMERYHTDIQFKLRERLRCRLREVLNGKWSATKQIKDMGCTLAQLKEHIEQQFQEGMTWDNWGQGDNHWQIDHIIPLVSFDLEDPKQVKKATHYTNLQPLWESENKSKGGKWEVGTW